MLNRRSFIEFLSGIAIAVSGAGPARAESRGAGGPPAPEIDRKTSQRVLPEGYRKPGAMTWGWGAGSDGILPNWTGGAGTKLEPRFIVWNDDKSATLKFDAVGGTWTAGELQVTRPKRSISERWGGILSSEKPSAVCALFAYAKDGTEIDFEWRGDKVWQLNLHLFDANGQRINPSPLPTVAVDISKPHAYEFSMNAEACSWFVDGKEVARITPKDMPGAIWKSDAHLELFVSIEHHGDWAKHDYADIPATMKVHGLLV